MKVLIIDVWSCVVNIVRPKVRERVFDYSSLEEN